MDLLKAIWPFPFRLKAKDVTPFVVQLVILIVAGAIIGALIGLLSSIPVVGLIFKIVGPLVEVYVTVGVVLCFLKFFNVIKD